MIHKFKLASSLATILIFTILIKLPSSTLDSSSSEWNVALDANLGVYSDLSSFGVAISATHGFDPAYDALEPPDPPTGLSAYFWYPENPSSPVDFRKLSTSIIPPSEQMNWTYNVKTIGVDGELCINWSISEISEIPLEYHVLFELPNGSAVDMRIVNEYCYIAESGSTTTFLIKISETCSLSIDVLGNGTTDPLPGSYSFDCGEEVTIDAMPDFGWTLEYWLLDGVNIGSEDPITILLVGSHTLTAKFKEGWDVTLTATIEGFRDESTFGVRNNATYGFDIWLDAIPPPPPPVGIESYFWYPDNPTSPVDFRRLSISRIPPIVPISWEYHVHPINVDGIVCINWSLSEVSDIPSEYCAYLQCPDGSWIDMRETAGYCFDGTSCTTYEFMIFIGGCAFDLELFTGWNMVSFPCMPLNPDFSSIFNGIFYQVYTWDGEGYISVTEAEAGKGYWVLVLENTTITITSGLPVLSYELDLRVGWNMIGSILPCTADANCVFPSFYQLMTWDGSGYVPSNTIISGAGYWALVLEPTHIEVNSSCCIS